MNPSRLVQAVGLALALVGIAGAALLYRSFGPIPDRHEAVGPFEIVTHTTRYLAGWNEGRLRGATTEHYSLRYRGKPFTFEGRGGMFGDSTVRYRAVNAVVTFPAPEPAVVVNAGDPNNTSFFYLVREAGGRARAEPLGEASGSVTAEWIDPPPGPPGERRDLAVHRRRLRGGRWLLLGDFAVLDTRTLRAYRMKPPPGAFLTPYRSALAMSPDQRSFVRLASGPSPENVPVLVVFDFVAGESYALPVDRRVMRYIDTEDVDAAWIAHHFAWRRGEDGRDRLERRAGLVPRPYQGRLTEDPYGDRSYLLAPVKPEMRDTLAAFVERALPVRRLRRGATPESIDFVLGERTITVLLAEDRVSLFMGTGSGSRPVADLARRFDAVLKTGAHDGLFVQ